MIAATVVLAVVLAFPGHTREALCVAQVESRFNPTAISETGDYGLFQVNHRWHPEYRLRSLLTIAGNIRAARKISRGGRDWSAWSSRTRRACRV